MKGAMGFLACLGLAAAAHLAVLGAHDPMGASTGDPGAAGAPSGATEVSLVPPEEALDALVDLWLRPPEGAFEMDAPGQPETVAAALETPRRPERDSAPGRMQMPDALRVDKASAPLAPAPLPQPRRAPQVMVAPGDLPVAPQMAAQLAQPNSSVGKITAPSRSASPKRPMAPRPQNAPAPPSDPSPQPGPEATADPALQVGMTRSLRPRVRPSQTRSGQPLRPKVVPQAQEQRQAARSGAVAQTSTKSASASAGRKAQAGTRRTRVDAAGGASSDPATLSRWGGRFRNSIERRKRYPSGTRASGTVLVSLAVGRDGTVLSVRVSRSSGDAALDRAAVQAVRRARLPAAPKGVGEGPHRFALPMVFSR